MQIEGDEGHSWWAQRDSLDHLVNPKKRGAAARGDEGADSAFASEEPRPHDPREPTTSTTSSSRWSPEDVYSWASSENSSAPTQPTPWQVLGLSSDASWIEITSRHRQLVKQHHPDRHSASGTAARVRAEQTMSGINAAFSELRRIYRLTGET